MLELIARNQSPVCHCMMVGTQNCQIFRNVLSPFPSWRDVVNRYDDAKPANNTFARKYFERNSARAGLIRAVFVVRIAIAQLIAVLLGRGASKACCMLTYSTAILSRLGYVRFYVERLSAILANYSNAFTCAQFGVLGQVTRCVLFGAHMRTIDVLSYTRRTTQNLFAAVLAMIDATLTLPVLIWISSFIGISAFLTAILLSWTAHIMNKCVSTVFAGFCAPLKRQYAFVREIAGVRTILTGAFFGDERLITVETNLIHSILTHALTFVQRQAVVSDRFSGATLDAIENYTMNGTVAP